MLLDLHHDVFSKVNPACAGKIRKDFVEIGDFIPPPPEKLRRLLKEFVDFFNNQFDNLDPIELAAFAHLWLVSFFIYFQSTLLHYMLLL